MLVLLLPTPVYLLLAWRRERAWRVHPLVSDAPYPAIRYWNGEPHRRCSGCGQAARTRGVEAGRKAPYYCNSCGAGFVVRFGALGKLLWGGLALAGGLASLASWDNS